MAVLLIGVGKTSIRIAKACQDAKVPFLLTSRRGEAGAPSGMHAAKFDYTDASTYDAPFQHGTLGGQKISAVYFAAAASQDPVPVMNAFIDHAHEKHGVNRFVLCAGTSIKQGGTYLGQVWQHMVDIGVEWCVLRPSWFNENLIEGGHLATIKGEGKIYSGTADGKIPFIGATDIAAVAFRALTDKKAPNTDYVVRGPELLTYDQVAAIISKALGRKVEHVKLTKDQNLQRYKDAGLPDGVALFMSWLEEQTANGMEDSTENDVERATGHAPQTFESWVQENKTSWQ